MLLTNFHTHCDYCDGAGTLEDVADEAVSQEFDVLGFSSHAPIAFEPEWTVDEKKLPYYLGDIDKLKEVYKDRLEIWKGLEIDYLEGLSGPSSDRYSRLNLDYAIGSVHMIKTADDEKYLAVDGPEEHLTELLEKSFGRSMEKLSGKYYSLIRQMVGEGGFQILGHLDLIKKRNSGNKYFDENAKWYRNQVLETLDAIRGKDIVVEVNTGGISRAIIDTVYPSPWIIKEASARNIPLMLNADSHVPDHISYYYKEALEIIVQNGYRELYALQGDGWKTFSI